MAIVAVPGSRVRNIVEGLDPERLNFFLHVRYVPLNGVIFRLLRAPEGVPERVYYPRREESDIARLGYQELPTDPSRKFLIMLPKHQFARQLVNRSDQETLDAFLAALRRRFPQVEPLIEDHLMPRWPEGLPTFPAGYTRALAKFRQLPPLPGIAFAGDYLCGPATGYAFASGEQAADEVLGRLG